MRVLSLCQLCSWDPSLRGPRCPPVTVWGRTGGPGLEARPTLHVVMGGRALTTR